LGRFFFGKIFCEVNKKHHLIHNNLYSFIFILFMGMPFAYSQDIADTIPAVKSDLDSLYCHILDQEKRNYRIQKDGYESYNINEIGLAGRYALSDYSELESFIAWQALVYTQNPLGREREAPKTLELGYSLYQFMSWNLSLKAYFELSNLKTGTTASILEPELE